MANSPTDAVSGFTDSHSNGTLQLHWQQLCDSFWGKQLTRLRQDVRHERGDQGTKQQEARPIFCTRKEASNESSGGTCGDKHAAPSQKLILRSSKKRNPQAFRFHASLRASLEQPPYFFHEANILRVKYPRCATLLSSSCSSRSIANSILSASSTSTPGVWC